MPPEALTALTSLAGVFLGGGLSYVVQRTAQRWSAQNQAALIAAQSSGKRREERLTVLDRFLVAAQEVEHVAYARWSGRIPNDEAIQSRHDASLERLWAAQRMVQVLFPVAVHEPAREMALTLHRAARHGPEGESVWEFLLSSRESFLEAARKEFNET